MTRLLLALAVLPLACLGWFARRRDDRLLREGAGECDAERVRGLPQAHDDHDDDRPATDRPYCRRCHGQGFYWDTPDEAHRPVWVRCDCPAGDPELDE